MNWKMEGLEERRRQVGEERESENHLTDKCERQRKEEKELNPGL